MKKRPELRLTGTIDRLLSHNDTTGSVVLRLSIQASSMKELPAELAGKRQVTVLGTLHGPKKGDRIRLVGTLEKHDRYSWQIRATRMLKAMLLHRAPAELVLKTGCFGRLSREEMSAAWAACPDLVNHLELGKPLPETKNDHTARVLNRLARAWRDCQPLRASAGFLDSLDLGPDAISRVLAVYGTGTIDLVTKSPYRLMGVPGIGFKTADDLAARLGFAKTAEARLSQSMRYLIRKARERGDTVISPSLLMTGAKKLTGNDSRELSQSLQRSVQRGRLTSGEGFIGDAGLVRLEREVAERLRARIGVARKLSLKSEGDSLYEEQHAAATELLGHQVGILTGGPGVGKTTVVRAMVEAFEFLNGDVLLAAPTSTAARRMSQATGRPVVTLHQLLEFAGNEGFKRNEHRPLEGSVLIVDEASMIDVCLMAHLLRALPANMRLILVGDKDQLPSVDAGNVLGDMIESGVVPTARLTIPRRTAEESMIVHAAHAILDGQMPTLDGLGDFRFIHASNAESIGRVIDDLMVNQIPALGIDPMGVQLITPQHSTPVGVMALNKRLQRLLNPQEETLNLFGEQFGVRDRIMQVANDYERGLNNGQTGVIAHIDREARQALARFDGRLMSLSAQDLAHIRLAYAATVHKSQGSEYDAVILPISSLHTGMLTRRLIYTALTRAKMVAWFIGEEAALRKGIANIRDAQRNTQLARLLRRAPALEHELTGLS